MSKFQNMFLLQSHLIAFNETAGIMPSDQFLLIKKIERHLAGQYACSAINSEGETYSAPYDLEIQCKSCIINKNCRNIHFLTKLNNKLSLKVIFCGG